jgi:HSP20 family protein
MTLPVLSRSRELTRPERPAWDPFRQFEKEFEEEFAELTRRMNTLWESGLGALERWSPLADVEESDDAYTVEVEVPGVARDDIDVQLDARRLTVPGEVKDKQRTGVLRRRTRRVGRFAYSVTLPTEVDADGVTARLHDGVLTIRVPKPETMRPRRIAITS